MTMAQCALLGSCTVCHEEVASVKILPCNHKLCLSCISNSLTENLSIECPFCSKIRQIESLNSLPTLHFGFLKCNICQEDNHTSKCYWCPMCVEIICSVCHIDVHSEKGHQIYKWDSLQAIKDCCKHSQEMFELRSVHEPEVSSESLKKIHDLCNSIEMYLVERLNQLRIHPFHETVSEFIGQLDFAEGNNLETDGSADQIAAVAKQIMDLVTGGNPPQFPADFSSIPKRIAIEKFTKTVKSLAETIWESVELKEEQDPSFPSFHLDTSPRQSDEEEKKELDLNKCIGSNPYSDPTLLLRMDELDGACGTETYTGEEAIESWTYQGNGKNLDKALAIINNNTTSPVEHLFMNITAPLEIYEEQQFPEIQSVVCLYLYTECYSLNAECGKNLSSMLSSLIKSFSGLRGFNLIGWGSGAGEVGSIYQHLPATVTHLGFYDTSIEEPELSIIACAIAEHKGFRYISVSPSDSTIVSMSNLVQVLAKCHNIKSLALAKLCLMPQNETKFLEGIKRWKHLEELHLSGMLHEEGQKKLHQLVQALQKLQRVECFQSGLSLPNNASFKKLCKNRNIEFVS